MVIKGESEGERGINRDTRILIYPLPYIKWITNKDLLYSTGSSEFSNDLLGKRTLKKVDIYVV